jgi:hypothetical protein
MIDTGLVGNVKKHGLVEQLSHHVPRVGNATNLNLSMVSLIV